MKEIEQLWTELESRLAVFGEEGNIIKRLELSKKAALDASEKLQVLFALHDGFNDNPAALVNYNRKLAPPFYARFIYFSKVLAFECLRLDDGPDECEKLFEIELACIKHFFHQHTEFRLYYLSERTGLDVLYFQNHTPDIIHLDEDEICRYLLESHAPKPAASDTTLQQSLDYLRDLMEEDGLVSLRQIWEYLLGERHVALDFATGMMDRVDRQRIINGLESFVLFLDPPLMPGSPKQTTLAEQLRQIFIAGLPLSFPFHGSYQRPSTTYFRQFTEREHVGQMYVLEYYSDLGVEECTVGEIANKLAAVEITDVEDNGTLVFQQGNPIHFYYDRLLHLVLDNEDQIDLSFKVGITCWLLLTQSDHFDLMAHRVGPGLVDAKDGLAPTPFPELFECWVYTFLVESLSDKQWSILKSPQHMSWVTSDKPGIVIDKREEAERSIFSVNLLRHLKGIRSFYYPLSKDYCLRLEPSTVERDMIFSTIRVEVSSEEEVKEVNALMGSLGKEMVISSDKEILESFRAKKYYP